MPAVLKRPHSILIQPAGPAHRGQMPRIVSLDLPATADPAGPLIDCREHVRALVRVRPDHDYLLRPFVWLTPNEADLRRTIVTRGESHASIKSRRWSSGGGGRHKLCRSGQSSRHRSRESARRQARGPTSPVGRHRPDADHDDSDESPASAAPAIRAAGDLGAGTLLRPGAEARQCAGIAEMPSCKSIWLVAARLAWASLKSLLGFADHSF